jgi:hypothetical protein
MRFAPSALPHHGLSLFKYEQPQPPKHVNRIQGMLNRLNADRLPCRTFSVASLAKATERLDFISGNGRKNRRSVGKLRFEEIGSNQRDSKPFFRKRWHNTASKVGHKPGCDASPSAVHYRESPDRQIVEIHIRFASMNPFNAPGTAKIIPMG